MERKLKGAEIRGRRKLKGIRYVDSDEMDHIWPEMSKIPSPGLFTQIDFELMITLYESSLIVASELPFFLFFTEL